MLIIVAVISGTLPGLSPLCPQAVPTSRADKEKPCSVFAPQMPCIEFYPPGMKLHHEPKKRAGRGTDTQKNRYSDWVCVCLVLGTHCLCQPLTCVCLWLRFQSFWYPQMRSVRNCAVWSWHEQHRPKIGDVRSIQNWIYLLAGVYSDFSGPKKGDRQIFSRLNFGRLAVRPFFGRSNVHIVNIVYIVNMWTYPEIRGYRKRAGRCGSAQCRWCTGDEFRCQSAEM